MKTIATSKGVFVVVDRKDDLPILTFISNMYDVGFRRYICKISEATEEDSKLVVDNYSDSNYKNYSEKQQDYPYFENPKYSLYSLIESKGIDINNGNWYLFKKV